MLEQQDVQSIEAHLAAVLDARLDAPGLAPLKATLRDYVLAGGKRIRPQLTAWTYRLASGTSTLPAAVLDLAASWEMFHAFLLIHDDIIDASPMRRDVKALHHQLAALDSNSLRFGTNLGIVAGDLLFSAAMGLWHELAGIDADTHGDLLRLFSRVACTTGFGQAIDICASHQPLDSVDQASLLRAYHWKTAAYTFEGPMVSGAILAGLDKESQAAISAFSLALGQAYQLQNDLHDLARPADAGCDLAQGKRTVMLLHHRTALDCDGRLRLDATLDAIAADDDRVGRAEILRRELIDADATAGTRSLIGSLLATARRSTADERLPAALSAGMKTLLDELGVTYFAPITP